MFQKSQTYIWGAGYYGTLTALYLGRSGVAIKGFIDKNAENIKTEMGHPVLSPSEKLFNENPDCQVIIAVNNENAIKEITEFLLQAGLEKDKSFIISPLVLGLNHFNLDADFLEVFQAKINISSEWKIKLFHATQKQNLKFTAQFMQDIMAYLFFEGKTGGFYIDIGAHDGYSGSTTYWAEQLGWNGICVEPQKELFEQLKKHRKCALYNFGLSDKAQKNIEFTHFPERSFRSGIASTMSAEHIEEAKKLSNMTATTIDTITFNDMMKDFPDIKHIDFISVDTEGHELNVLQSIDFDKYTFGLMTIETQENSGVVKFVKGKGYKPLLTAGSDVVFVPTNYPERLICCLSPFQTYNIYIELMKLSLQRINIGCVSDKNIDVADFIWYHWLESQYENEQILPRLKLLANSGKKIIFNFHNKIPHETKEVKKAKEFVKTLIEISCKIVIHSNESIQIIQDICQKDAHVLNKIVCVPHPHYIGIYGAEKTAASLPNNKLKLCFFGAIRKYKNIDLLISAVKELDFDDVELNIVGNCYSDEYAQYLQNLIGENRNIKCDFRLVCDENIPEIIDNSHILVLPYNLESSLNSGTTIMAFSYSRTVLSSQTGTLSDIEDKSFFFAYSYKTQADHKEELKKQIATVREKYKGNYNELLKLGTRAKKYVEKHNSVELVTERLSEVFETKSIKAKISVLIPVYNAEKHLRKCLDSVLDQTYTNIEAVCVNDCSTDNSLAILNEYARKDKRIIVIDKHINEDASFARRDALVHSTGQYILCVDSDDWIEPDMLECLYNAALFNNYDIVCSGYFEERENGTTVFAPQNIHKDKIGRIKYGIFGFGNIKLLWNKLVKREVYENIVFKNVGTNEDCLIAAQLFYYANKIGYINKPLYHWQFNECSVTNNKSLSLKRYEDRKANYLHIIEFCKEKFGNDLSVFEPDLSIRMANIERQNPELILKCLNSNRDIYIYGAGIYGERTASIIKYNDVKIKGFIDKNATKIKSKLGLPVFEPNEILSNKNNDVQIIIAVADINAIREIVDMLMLAGLKREDDFVLTSLISIPVSLEFFEKEKTLDHEAMQDYCRNIIKKRNDIYLHNEETAKKLANDWNGTINKPQNIRFIDNAIPIVLCANEKFAPYLSVMLQSILEHTNSQRKYHFIILERDFKSEVKKRLETQTTRFPHCTIDFISVTEAFEDIPLVITGAHFSIDMYSRLFIPYWFDKYKKVIYLDSDMFAKSDIAELYDLDIQNYCLAAAIDQIYNWNLKHRNYTFFATATPTFMFLENWHRYFNSGVLIFDTKKFKEKFSYQDLFKFAIYYTNRYTKHFGDQEILNLLIKDDYFTLPPQWNYQWHAPSENGKSYQTAKVDTKIIHFTHKKPWDDIPEMANNPVALAYLDYMKKITNHI